MSSEDFEVRICEDVLKLSIQANQPHHSNIIETLLRFQEGKHDEIISINGLTALISTIVTPDFLQCDIFETSNHILIQSYQRKYSQPSQNWTSTPNSHASRYTSSESDSQADSAIFGGAPLESPFAVHEFDSVSSPLIYGDKSYFGKQEFSFNGFPLEKAQLIAREVRKVVRRREEATLIKNPIFIACDGINSQKIIFLGVYNKVLIRASRSSVFHEIDHLPSISHLTYNFICGCYSKEVMTSAEAKYEILKRTDYESSSVTVNCSWKRPSGMLCIPTIDLLSDVELFVCSTDSNNAAHTLQIELSLLESLIVGSERGEVMWNVKQTKNSVADQLRNIFDNCNECKIDKPDHSLFKLENLIEQKFSQVRQNMDFTDQVWNALKESESYMELESGFELIFRAINTDFIRPFIHQIDVTKLAKSCKQIMRGGEKVNINELESLKMLIEIGLEKIKRDYMNVFIASELVPNDELSPFISWSSVTDDPKKCLKLLKKLCLALQCVALLRKYVELPQSVLSNCTTNIFKRLQNSDDLPSNFKFSIQNIFLQEKFCSTSLSEWTFRISSCDEKDKPKQMMYRVTKQPLFRDVYNEDIETDPNGLTKYYGFSLSIFSDSLIP